MAAPKSTTDNLAAPTPGREITQDNNWAMRALLQAFLDARLPRLDSLRLLRRGVRLYSRDKAAIKQAAYEADVSPAQHLTHVLRLGRWAAKRALVLVGLDTDLTEAQFQEVENRLTADFMRYLLGSDHTEVRRAARQRPLSGAEPTGADGFHERADAPLLAGEEAAQVDAELHHVFAAATKTHRAQLRRIIAVWRKAPHLTYAEACMAAGLTADQRKKLTSRLRSRLT